MPVTDLLIWTCSTSIQSYGGRKLPLECNSSKSHTMVQNNSQQIKIVDNSLKCPATAQTWLRQFKIGCNSSKYHATVPLQQFRISCNGSNLLAMVKKCLQQFHSISNRSSLPQDGTDVHIPGQFQGDLCSSRGPCTVLVSKYIIQNL